MIEAIAEGIASVVIALQRDRVGVPEGLADALATLLVFYAANTADRPGSNPRASVRSRRRARPRIPRSHTALILQAMPKDGERRLQATVGEGARPRTKSPQIA